MLNCKYGGRYYDQVHDSCIMRTLHMEAAAYLPLPNVNMLKRPITYPTSRDRFMIDTGTGRP